MYHRPKYPKLSARISCAYSRFAYFFAYELRNNKRITNMNVNPSPKDWYFNSLHRNNNTSIFIWRLELLGSDLFEFVFTFLDLKSISNCSLACKKYYVVTTSPSIWYFWFCYLYLIHLYLGRPLLPKNSLVNNLMALLQENSIWK